MKKNKYKFLSQIAVALSLLIGFDLRGSVRNENFSSQNNDKEADVISVDLNDVDSFNNVFNQKKTAKLEKSYVKKPPLTGEDDKLNLQLDKASSSFLLVELNLKKIDSNLGEMNFSSLEEYKVVCKDVETIKRILQQVPTSEKRFSMFLSAYYRNVLRALFSNIYFEYDIDLLNKLSLNMKKYLGESFIDNIKNTGIAEKISKGNLAYSNILNRLAYSSVIFTCIINDTSIFPELSFIAKDSVKNLYQCQRIQELMYRETAVANFKILNTSPALKKLLWLLGNSVCNYDIADEDFIKCFDYYESSSPRLLGVVRLLTMLSTIKSNMCEDAYKKFSLQQKNPPVKPYEEPSMQLRILQNMIKQFLESFPQYRNCSVNDIIDYEHNLKETLSALVFLFVKTSPSVDNLKTPKKNNQFSVQTFTDSPSKNLFSQIIDSPVRSTGTSITVGKHSEKIKIDDLSLQQLMFSVDEDNEHTKSRDDEIYAQISSLTVSDLCEFLTRYINDEYKGNTPYEALLLYKKASNKSEIIDFRNKDLYLNRVENFDHKSSTLSLEGFSVCDLAYSQPNSHLSNADKESLLLILTMLMSERSEEENNILNHFIQYELPQLKVYLFSPLNVDFSDESIKIIELGKTKLYPSEQDLAVAARYTREQNCTYKSIDSESRNKLLINLNILSKKNLSLSQKSSAEQAVFTILSQNYINLYNSLASNNSKNKDFTSFDIHMMLVDAAHINSIPFAIEAWLAIRLSILSPEHKALLNALSSLSLSNSANISSSRMNDKCIVFKFLKKEYDILERSNPQYTSFDVFNLLSDLINIKSTTFAVQAWLVMKEFSDTSIKLPEIEEHSSKPLLTNASFPTLTN